MGWVDERLLLLIHLQPLRVEEAVGRTETMGADVIVRPNRDPTESTLFIPSVTERIQRAGSLVQWSAYFLVPDVSVEMLVVRPSDSQSSTEAFTLLGRTKVTCSYARRFDVNSYERFRKDRKWLTGSVLPIARHRVVRHCGAFMLFYRCA